MIKIDNRYLENNEIRSNTTTRTEIFAAQIVDKIICQNDNWNVGTETSFNLPDIYNDEKNLGFEVVRCEAQIDFIHDDITKEFSKINYDYNKYLEIKNNDKDHIFNKIDLNVSFFQDKISSSSVIEDSHSIDWMFFYYKNTIEKKLNKLNKGNYSECKNVSLIILNLDRVNAVLSAQQVYYAFLQISNNFKMNFKNIYYITTMGVYIITKKTVSVLKLFTDDEFCNYVKYMKKSLKIDEYQECN